MDPAKDGKRFMRGSEEEKSLREIAWLIDKELVGSDQFVGGLSTFPPGMTARLHAHPDAEEINVILEGEGDFITPDGDQPVKKGDFQFIPKGVEHSHRNTGKGSLTIVWVYSPPPKSVQK
ncbi:MAG: cupin domain-containing protein [Deltaproteobacteria bacterium]|nr:cupin domain-containing protein [Deltaproteobacteria bacterium]